ncbi:hypothetical protein ACQPZ8_19285 [Actinomadura nitritigenes]|uniref:hypothetical protein n=1 Tax=Actinomadura nitritigenes TaxID=134602 RepID=UPI003D94AD25
MRNATSTGCDERVRQCRAERVEPPAPDRVTRMVRSALHMAEENWFAVIAARLDPQVRDRPLDLIEFRSDRQEQQGDADDQAPRWPVLSGHQRAGSGDVLGGAAEHRAGALPVALAALGPGTGPIRLRRGSW